MSQILLHWPIPNKFPNLEMHQAHIWSAVLNYDIQKLKIFFDLLDADEQVRANRFHFEKDRNQFIASHGILRKILSGYLNISPEKIIFSYNEFGKPFIANQSDIQFNLSHSKNITLIAITKNYSIGVDIEYIKQTRDIEAIAERYFSTHECSALKQLPTEERQKAFFNGWSRKEAFLKAHGQGLSYSLEKVEVSLATNEPAKFIAIHDANENISEWELYNLEPANDFAAAVAIKGELKKIEMLQWQENI